MWIRCQADNRHDFAKRILRLAFTALLTIFILSSFYQAEARAESNPHTIGFQGRLLLKSGGPVDDGSYNMRLRIYQGGDGLKTGNPSGELVWSEDYLNSSKEAGVPVKNGRFSINLGSRQQFGDKVDWSKGNLWLSMNIAGNGVCDNFGSTNCQADGEMLPMKRISASPYAMSAGKLGDKTADDFVQIGKGKQFDNSNGSSIFIDKTGNGNLIQLQSSGRDSFTVTNSGDIRLSGRSNRSITLESSSKEGSNLTIKAGGGTGNIADGGDLVLSGGDSESNDGGDLILKGGSGNDGNTSGLVVIGTPTFSTTTSDSNCRPDGNLASDNCEIATKSIDNTAAIIVGFDTEDKSARLPNPSIKTPGRIIYIIGASDSKEFSLVYDDKNNSITVMPDTATSLMWNGKQWVPVTPSPLDKKPPAAESDESTETVGDDNKSDQSSQPVDEDATATVEGSMYYDDDLGKIRCYQSGVWSDCAAAPDAFVTISPEYSGAVMNGTDLGTITSDLCSDVLNINDGSDGEVDAVCGKNETFNFYQWSTTENDPQTRSIYLNYKLPINFKEFVPDQTMIMARIGGEEAKVSYQLYRDRKTENLETCGEAVTLDKEPGVWRNLKAEKEADPANCKFKPGDSLLIRINLTAEAAASAYVSNIEFVYSTR